MPRMDQESVYLTKLSNGFVAKRVTVHFRLPRSARPWGSSRASYVRASRNGATSNWRESRRGVLRGAHRWFAVAESAHRRVIANEFPKRFRTLSFEHRASILSIKAADQTGKRGC